MFIHDLLPLDWRMELVPRIQGRWNGDVWKVGLELSKSKNLGFASRCEGRKNPHYLDGIKSFNSHIAILINITPDHLDRYEYDFNKYVEAKFKITKNQKETDYLIYDADDPVINNWLKENKTSAKLVPFSLEKELKFGAYIKENNIIININKDKITMPISALCFKTASRVAERFSGNNGLGIPFGKFPSG